MSDLLKKAEAFIQDTFRNGNMPNQLDDYLKAAYLAGAREALEMAAKAIERPPYGAFGEANRVRSLLPPGEGGSA